MDFVCSRDIGDKLNQLIEKKNIGRMFNVIQMESDIPETFLIKALRVFLSAPEDSLEKAIDQLEIAVKMEDGGQMSATRRVFIDMVLLKEFNEVHIVENLKKIPFALVVDLLKYIFFRIRDSDRDSDKLFTWIGLIIDAHASQFVISKDVHETLVQFSHEEEQHSTFIKRANQELMPLLKAITTSSEKKSQAMGQYCIEMLYL